MSGDSLKDRMSDSITMNPEARALSTFGRSWRYGELAERVERMTDTLDRLGVGPGRRLGLLLPPVPTGAMAMLAAFRLGAEVVAVNPMQRGDELLDRLSVLDDGVLVTLDLTRLQDRWVRVFPDLGLEAVLVEKMSELLPFPRNILMPMMRGGEIASIPRNDRTAPLPKVLRAAAVGREWPRVAGASVRAAGGPASSEAAVLRGVDALLRIAGGAKRWMLVHHLDAPWAMTALMAPLTAGRDLVLMPRLDRRTVARALAKERPQVALLSAAVAEELAEKPPEPGTLDLAVVPPGVENKTRKLLKRATGCRVEVWDGPDGQPV